MIELRNVTKKYGKKTILDDVNITFEKGKISCLLGLNGVGKSTTMKSIMKLIPITKGQILLEGQPVNERNIDKIAFLADVPTHDLNWTVEENLQMANIYYDSFNMDKAREMVAFFNLPQDRRLKELSKGNLARFTIIVGLSQNAPYVLMDEPFSGIDIFSREEFIASLKSRFMIEGQTIIITTHEIDEIETIADHVFLLEEGKVLCSFSKEEAEKEGYSIVEKMRKIYRG
ncbi:ABC transporter ATP-binding protein [Bacillus testis]|uniref:ABC transporter ATP-binding protein n=1 Tax=Bacillus testis TaxID=1622072 RepID=UPI00067ECE58|nr:ABC transporter ATP-binding protein [Bacillus testis]